MAEPLPDNALWDRIKTDRQSFDMLMSKRKGRMTDSESRWLTNQLMLKSRSINTAAIELNERAHGQKPKPIAP